MLRIGPYCYSSSTSLIHCTSNKAVNSSSSTLLLMFRTNRVLEGCSPSGCSPNVEKLSGCWAPTAPIPTSPADSANISVHVKSLRTSTREQVGRVFRVEGRGTWNDISIERKYVIIVVRMVAAQHWI